jgi:hypothetical protein
MLYFLSLLLIVLLLLIAFQDFTQRQVHWLLFPVLFLVIAGINFVQNLFLLSFKEGTLNASFVIVQIFLATLYFSIKEKKPTNIFSSYFGLGDLLFLLSISIGMSVGNYVAFYVGSLLVTIAIFAMLIFAKRDVNYQIPLAGTQSILFLLVYFSDFLLRKFSLHDDSMLLSLLPHLK